MSTRRIAEITLRIKELATELKNLSDELEDLTIRELSGAEARAAQRNIFVGSIVKYAPTGVGGFLKGSSRTGIVEGFTAHYVNIADSERSTSLRRKPENLTLVLKHEH